MWKDYFDGSNVYANPPDVYATGVPVEFIYAGVGYAVGIADRVQVSVNGQIVDQDDYTYAGGIITPTLAGNWQNGDRIAVVLFYDNPAPGGGGGGATYEQDEDEFTYAGVNSFNLGAVPVGVVALDWSSGPTGFIGIATSQIASIVGSTVTITPWGNGADEGLLLGHTLRFRYMKEV